MPSNKKLLQAAAGSAGDDNLFVEDVFSTYVYGSTHGTSPIVNGINLADEGGLVWFKHRTATYSNILFDTERGTSNHLVSNTTAGNATSIGLGSFNTDGFSFSGGNLNVNSASHVAWSFRKAEGFCDIVTYTGNDTARTIAHNLGSVPKMIIVKSTSDTYNWYVYHASLTNQQNLTLDTSNPAGNSGAEYWNSTTATSSVFSLGTYFGVNGNNKTYVAYLFGDDAVFGEDADEQICKIGSYTGTGSNGNTITLGFEPQWLMWKPSSGTGDWQIVDSMREWTADGVANRLEPNNSDAEALTGSTYCNLTSTGFVQNGSSGSNNASGTTYIYMAIRRPMKVPEAGTEVFITNATSGVTNLSAGQFVTGFPVDLNINGQKTNSTLTKYVLDRLRGNGAYLSTAGSSVSAAPNSNTFMFNNGDASTVVDLYNGWWGSASGIISWSFKRAPKFMDTICYTGNGTAGATPAHNLQVAPELIMFKSTSSNTGWISYWSTLGLGYYLLGFDSTTAIGTGSLLNNTAPTASIITLSTQGWNTNNNGDGYVAYLFATLAGVSKVGSYTGTGATLDVDCGFSNGARLIIIRRTDVAGDWFIYDSVRGIVSGNDPYLILNTTAAEVTNTDYIDPLSSGFTVTSSAPVGLNASSGNYVFLAIA